FTLGASVVVRAGPADAATAQFLRAHLRDAWRQGTAPRGASSGTITLTSSGSEALPPEGYRLVIAPTGVTIVGRGAGLFYGVQSLLQLILANSRAAIDLSAAVFVYLPRFAYRVLHLDVSRYFFPLDDEK